MTAAGRVAAALLERGLAPGDRIEAIAAVIVPAREVSADELIAFSRERLAAHKVPKSVHFVDELPKNASGKLLKRELRAALGGSGSAVGSTAGADVPGAGSAGGVVSRRRGRPLTP